MSDKAEGEYRYSATAVITIGVTCAVLGLIGTIAGAPIALLLLIPAVYLIVTGARRKRT
jgi:hypothetical protein